jgi:hypothetical protein
MGVVSGTTVLATPLGTPFLTFPPDGGKEPRSETPHLAVAYLQGGGFAIALYG